MKDYQSPPYLGEEGTEQFTIETEVDGESIGKPQPIHDPFVSHTVKNERGWWSQFLGLFLVKHRRLSVVVRICGTQAAQARIMTMNPFELQAENEERATAKFRENAQAVVAGNVGSDS